MVGKARADAAHRPDCSCQLGLLSAVLHVRWTPTPQFIALEFKLPFVNLWSILVM